MKIIEPSVGLWKQGDEAKSEPNRTNSTIITIR